MLKKSIIRLLHNLSIFAIIFSLIIPTYLQLNAQERKLSFIRDAEIEQVMREYLEPLLAAAGLRKGIARVILVSDKSFNAFVADGKRVFVNIGAIMDSTSPNHLIGVLAHETGHIAGGHLARMRAEVDKATAIAVITTILGGAALIGGMNSSRHVGSTGEGAMGALLGGQEAAMRSLLAYQRGEELAADRAALKFLDKTGQSPKGLLETFERMANEALFSSTRMDKYLQSHPMAQDRVALLREEASKSRYFSSLDPPQRQAKHEMIRAKLYAFTSSMQEILRKYPSYNVSNAAQYARAIGEYRFGRLDEALKKIDALISSQPTNPYLWELRGQALLEGGRPNDAISPLRKAVSIAPNQPLIRNLLGHALLASETTQNLKYALQELSNATSRDPDNYEGFQYLAQAYAKNGDEGNAALASSRGALIEGDTENAKIFAKRAMNLLLKDSPAYLAAKDIAKTEKEDLK